MEKRTSLPRAALLRGLSGARRSAGAIVSPAEPFWTLPRPNADAERDAFEAEDRDALRAKGIDTSAELLLGAGAVSKPDRPQFPYASLALRIERTPYFFLFRGYSASGFVEAAGGLGDVKKVRGALGASLGVHLGPLHLQGLAAVGGDGVVFTRDDGIAPSINEPEVPLAFSAGYGARAVLRTGDLTVMANARRVHRMDSTFKLMNVAEAAIAYQVWAVSARYELYRDIFTGGNPNAADAPTSLTIALGILFELQSSKAGEVSGRTQ
jgi:hypothetical protein